MRELDLQGIHDDDEHLVLIDSDGEQYTLRIDESLRAAVRRDRPALGMIRAEQATPLRPREIQAMLRAGRSPEAIAEMSGISAEHIRRYEGPVLAERAYTAERARRFHVGRGGGPLFGDVVEERLAARQAEEARRWDAWRLPDGTWTVELGFTAGGRERTAHWIVDVERQTVLAEDDEARWLTEDDAAPAPGAGSRGRLTPIRASVYDLEADGAFDPSADTARPAIRTVPRRGHSEHPSAIAQEELDALQARRGLRPVPAAEDDGSGDPVWESLEPVDEQVDGADVDDEAAREHAADTSPAEDRDPARDPSASASDAPATDDAPRPDDAPATDDAPAAGASADRTARAADGDPRSGAPSARPLRHHPAGAPHEPDIEYLDTVDLPPLPGFENAGEQDADDATSAGDETSGEARPAAPHRTAKERSGTKKSSQRRSSVPSWDEIVFGTKED